MRTALEGLPILFTVIAALVVLALARGVARQR